MSIEVGGVGAGFTRLGHANVHLPSNDIIPGQRRPKSRQ